MSGHELLALDVAASTLQDDQIHVWRVAYKPALGRQPLLHVLAAYLGCAEAEIILESEEYGRPRLAPGLNPAFDFNWSHSRNDALIAIGRHVRPGVDVERIRPRPRLLEIASRYFDPCELGMLEQLPEEDRLSAFLRLWTAKEAILKAVGRGIAFGLDRVCIDLSPTGAPMLRRLGDSGVEGWQLHELPFEAGLCAAVAWSGSSRQVRTGRLAVPE